MQIIKTVIQAKPIPLKSKWRLIWERVDLPMHLNLEQFPFKVYTDFSNLNELIDLCNHHVGVLDETWTYTNSCTFYFKTADHAVWFRLNQPDS